MSQGDSEQAGLKESSDTTSEKGRLGSRIITMNTLLESSSKQTELSSQASQAKPVANEPTTQEMADWDDDKLLQWIQQKEPELLEDENLEKFKAACISGKAFLKYAGNEEFFRKKCNLPAGTSSDLSDLGEEIKKSKKSKHYLSYHGRNSDSQLTVSQGDSEQAGLKEPSDITSKKRRLDSRKEVSQSLNQKRLRLSLLPGSGALYETESAEVRCVCFHSTPGLRLSNGARTAVIPF